MIELVLDTLLPGDSELGMPPASSLDFELYQLRHKANEQVEAFLVMLAKVAHDKFDRSFEALDATQRLAAIKGCKLVDVHLFSAFLTHVMRAYYADRRILVQASAGAVPPFPAGNELDSDNWTILEPVYLRGSICRSTNPVWQQARRINMQETLMLLKDKTAVITGANRGIGRTITETFAAQGANVVACMREVTAEASDWLTGLAQTHGISAQAVSVDLADEASVKLAVKQIMSVASRIDVLVNNAGVASGGLFQMTSMTELRHVFEINFFSQSQILLTQGLARLMARNKAGSIINIASTAAIVADVGTLAYGASKAAFARATQSMATELGASGIRMNAIAPGVTRTDMFDQMSPAARDNLIASSVLKRVAELQDVANMALFLASDLSTFVTGQIMRVDGGMV